VVVSVVKGEYFVLTFGLAGGLLVEMISFEFLLFLLTLKHWHTLGLPEFLFSFMACSRRFSIHRVSTAGDDYLCKLQVLQGRHMRIC